MVAFKLIYKYCITLSPPGIFIAGGLIKVNKRIYLVYPINLKLHAQATMQTKPYGYEATRATCNLKYDRYIYTVISYYIIFLASLKNNYHIKNKEYLVVPFSI